MNYLRNSFGLPARAFSNGYCAFLASILFKKKQS